MSGRQTDVDDFRLDGRGRRPGVGTGGIGPGPVVGSGLLMSVVDIHGGPSDSCPEGPDRNGGGHGFV